MVFFISFGLRIFLKPSKAIQNVRPFSRSLFLIGAYLAIWMILLFNKVIVLAMPFRLGLDWRPESLIIRLFYKIFLQKFLLILLFG